MSDWDDRAIDAALRELHGSKPPDLSARVLLALQEQAPASLPTLSPAKPWLPWPQLLAVLAASLLLGLGAALLVVCRSAPPAEVLEVAMAVEVLAGEVACESAGVLADDRAGSGAAVAHLGTAGSTLAFAAAPGRRMWCPRASTFRIGTFGVLTAMQDTELEVKDMAIGKLQGVVVASSLTLAVVAGVVTWHSLTRSEAAVAGESVTMMAGSAPAPTLAAENADLRRRIDELERQNRALRTADAERQPAPEPAAVALAATVPEAAPAPAVTGMVFSDPRFAEALAKIDWAKMGEVTHEMSPVLAELVAAMTKEGAELPMELAIKVQQLNLKLLEQVPALLAAKVPGFGANGSYTHPLVAANTLATTLQAAGQAMTPAQQQKLAGLVNAFSNEAQSIADSEHDMALDQLLAETEMKDRFFAEMGGALTPEQSKAIYPGGANGYDGASLFDTGVTMRAHMQPIEASNAGEFARTVSQNLSQQLGLDEATAQQVRDIIARGAAADELWRDRAAPAETSQAHFLRSGRTKAALRHQVEWMRQIRQNVQLSPDQLRKLGKMSRVLVPLPR
jgi:hypothetical protein